MKAEELDTMFDNGEDMSAHIDMSSIRQPNLESKRVNVDFPSWMVESLDDEAQRIGVTRQSVIKLWIAERLEQVSRNVAL